MLNVLQCLNIVVQLVVDPGKQCVRIRVVLIDVKDCQCLVLGAVGVAPASNSVPRLILASRFDGARLTVV